MNELTIEVEDDPVPIVKIIAAQFERSMRYPEFVRTARGLNGSFALASTVDPQAVTVTGKGGRIRVKHGISPEAGLVIRLDFNKPDESPNIEGLWRHPLLALKVDKLMKTYDTDWADCAERFWRKSAQYPGMPEAIQVRCTDTPGELTLGKGEPEVTIEASSKNLCELLSGGTILVLAVMEGKVRIVGTMKHLTILSEATKDMLLGEC